MRVLSVGLLALVIAACGVGDPAGTDTTAAATNSTTTTSTTVPPEHSHAVARAMADLAGRLEIDTDQIELVTEEPVTWSDGSIGCPEPGMSYTQALVEGYRIVLAVDDTEYRYHGATGGDPFLCERPGALSR